MTKQFDPWTKPYIGRWCQNWGVWPTRYAYFTMLRPAMCCTTLEALKDCYRGWPKR